MVDCTGQLAATIMVSLDTNSGVSMDFFLLNLPADVKSLFLFGNYCADLKKESITQLNSLSQMVLMPRRQPTASNQPAVIGSVNGMLKFKVLYKLIRPEWQGISPTS